MVARPEQLVRHIRRLASVATPSPDTDALLLAHFVQHRNEEAFAALVQRHGPMVMGVCRRILGNVQDAEDAFQAAFLVLARKADSVQPREALTAWLYGVARRVALKARTTKARQTRGTRPLTPSAIDPHTSTLDDLSSRELLAIFDAELQRLPRTYRLPLILCCLEGRTQEEAARQLGWTAGSVKGRLERGRARLQTRLRRRGLLLSAALMVVEAARGRVSAALGAATVKESLSFAAGRGSEGVAQSLAELVCRGMAWTRGMVWAGLLSAVFVAAATSTLGLHALADKPAESEPPTASAPEQPEARKDRHGDPLPPQAIARLGTTRLRGARGFLTFSPDGKMLAATTGSGGQATTIWEVATGRKIRQLKGSYAVFSPDGKRVACSDNLHCHILDLSNGKELFAVEGIWSAFSGDGKILVTTNLFGTDLKVSIWDASTGRLLRETLQERNGFRELTLAVQGQTLAVLSAEALAVDIHDLATGKKIRSVRNTDRLRGVNMPDCWHSLALTRDGKTLATVNARGVQLWDIASGDERGGWNGRVASQPVFAPDGKRLAWTGGDDNGGNVRLWVLERRALFEKRMVGAPVCYEGPPCFSPDGKFLAVLTDARAVSLREAATGKEFLNLDAHDSPVTAAAFTPDGRRVISRARTGLFVWETRTGRLLRRNLVPLPDQEAVEAFLPDGRLLTADLRTDEGAEFFRVRDLRTGQIVLRLEGSRQVITPIVALAPGGRYIATHGRDGTIGVYDLQGGRCLYRLDSREQHHGLQLSSDGDVLVWYRLTGKTFEVHVHRHASGKTFLLRDMPKTDRWVWTFDNRPHVSPDGRWLIFAGEGGRLRRWDLTTGKELPPLTGAMGHFLDLDWSPDGRYLIVHGARKPSFDNADDSLEPSRSLRVWDVATGTRLAHLTLPDKAGSRFLFSPDGRTLLTTDSQGVLHFWEVATGKERGQLRGHLSGIGALTFSADGRLLVSGGYDSQGFVWDVTGRMPDGQWRLTTNSPEQRRASWEALASSDAKAAYRALWQLAADPDETLALVREQVRPIARPTPGQAKRAIAALDSAEFVERERAADELEKFGETISVDLRLTLSQKPSLEVRRRIEALLEKLEGIPYGRQLQAMRSLEVLEHIDTVDARTVLRTLADGAAGARLTEEARQALQRTAASKRP